MTRLLWLADELRAWGLDVVEVTGWRDRARPGAFDPVGVLIHHTAGPRGKDAPSLQVCIDGRRDLPGPLCQLLIARSGKVYVISAGRCNHAGEGGPIAPSGIDPIGKDQGNRQLVGIEAENDGTGEPWPAAQVDAMARASAAVLDLLGRPRACCWGHKEYAPGRKPDPTGIDMGTFRSMVAAAKRPGDTTVPTNPPTATEAALIEQWQQMLLDNGAPIGNKDGRFGRLTLEHSRKVLDHRNQLLAQVAKLEADVKHWRDRAVEVAAAGDIARAKVAELERRLAADTRGDAVLALVAEIADLATKMNQAGAKLQGLA